MARDTGICFFPASLLRWLLRDKKKMNKTKKKKKKKAASRGDILCVRPLTIHAMLRLWVGIEIEIDFGSSSSSSRRNILNCDVFLCSGQLGSVAED